MSLVLEGVKKKYKNFELDCSLKLETGCVTGLVGRNGAGKSTSFKAVLGLIKPDSGSIMIDGKSVEKLTVQEKADIGVVLSDSGFNGHLRFHG